MRMHKAIFFVRLRQSLNMDTSVHNYADYFYHTYHFQRTGRLEFETYPFDHTLSTKNIALLVRIVERKEIIDERT